MLYSRVAAVLILGLLGAAPVWTQQDSCQTRTVPVSIMSDDGSPLPDINDAAFEGSYRGKSVRINSVAIDQRPRRVLLLLDTSGSFTDKLDWAFNVANDTLEHIPLPTEIGLVSFANTVERAVPPTPDRTEIRNEIKSLRSTQKQGRGQTALRDAIRDSVKVLDSQQVGDVIFAITDGGDNKSKTEPRELIQILVTAGIRLFVLEVVD